MAIDHLSRTFSALADPTRRAILARLISGEASVTELAQPFEMSLPAISKHLKVLEHAGLIVRSRDAQWRPCRLEARPLKGASDWLERYRTSGSRASIAWKATSRNCKARRSDVAGSISATADRELVVTRVIDAPRRLVFRAWTQPGAHRALVGTTGLHHHPLRDGHPRRRHLPLRHAIAARHRALETRRLSRNS